MKIKLAIAAASLGLAGAIQASAAIVDYTSAGVDPSFTNGADANFTSFTDVTFTAQAVPEPAAWAMMLVGFGGIGAMLRSAKRKFSGVVAATA
jgi:hypothetical protein